MLTVLDEYSREALCVKVVTRMGPAEVLEILEVLYLLLLRRGKPEYLRSDNGPEFSSAPFKDWLLRVGIQPVQIYPGSPSENGYNERFNGRLSLLLQNEAKHLLGQALGQNRSIKK